MFISGVNDTGEKSEKFWDKIFLKYFVKSFVECTLHLKIEVSGTAKKFIAGVVDTTEQFIAGVVDTADKHSFAIISANFQKKLKWS